MSRKKSAKKSKTDKLLRGRVKTAAQEALEVTWVLKGHLKNAQIAYIRVGKLLAQVRDRKLYAALHHPDIESYAEQRLSLGRASLYRYLQVYDWISKYHKEWLEPRPKGFIPELADAGDLMWIEQELERKGLSAEKRAALDGLREKALNGKLRTGELNRWRRKSFSGAESIKSFLSKLRHLRKRGARLVDMPSEVVSHLDTAIEILKNAHALEVAGIGLRASLEGVSFQKLTA